MKHRMVSILAALLAPLIPLAAQDFGFGFDDEPEAESGACLLMPTLIWTKDDVAVSLSSGIFAGNEEGLFGQFHDKSFVRAAVKYTF